MSMIFKGSDKATLGVEIELQILDASSLDLSPQSSAILSICKTQNLMRINSEIHQSMIEVNSDICDHVKESSDDLQNTIVQLSDILDSQGLKLALTGTHPFQKWQERLISEAPRYQTLYGKYQWLARRMNIYGLHVHIGTPSGDRALAICNAMIPYLPLLLALSANSPFWNGTDTGMQSSRINIMDAFPFSGIPLHATEWVTFETYYNTLHRVKAIQSFKDLYWYVRPHPVYGTVEIRICDVPSTLNETMALVALIQCVVAKLNQEIDNGQHKKLTQQEYWIAPENLWTAAKDGLDGEIIMDLDGSRKRIADVIAALIDTLSPIARQLNCYEELQHNLDILVMGNGASRQRAFYQKTGSLTETVQHMLIAFENSIFQQSSMDK